MGAKVIGVSIDVPCEPSNYEAANLSNLIDDRRIDIRDLENVKSIIEAR